MILYFNTKLVNSSLINSEVPHSYFYPIVYPRSESILSKCSPFSILLKTIKSYSVIDFTAVIFNIEIDLDIPNYKKILSDFINDNFKQSNVILNFNRPSTIQDWILDINGYKEQINFNEPVFVAMNHDHPFVDYQTVTFSKIVSKVFTYDDNNFKKVLYYSHAPETFSWAINGRGEVKYKCFSGNISVSSDVDNWIDSIGIMTFNTLLYLWQKAEFKGSYIGRLDWDNVKYRNLELAIFSFPREFCKHYDGYNHITGLRLDHEIQSYSKLPYNLPPVEETDRLLNFYYSRWLDISFLMIRDFLIKRKGVFGVKKETFVEGIEISLKPFIEAYLAEDIEANIIDNTILPQLVYSIRNKIFYNANWLYNEMMIDIELLRPFTWRRFFLSKLKYMFNELAVRKFRH